jgi:ubiquitin-protein ligase
MIYSFDPKYIVKQTDFLNKGLELINTLNLDKSTKHIIRNLKEDYRILSIDYSGPNNDFYYEGGYYKYRITYQPKYYPKEKNGEYPIDSFIEEMCFRKNTHDFCFNEI